jgi:hypothetical protein
LVARLDVLAPSRPPRRTPHASLESKLRSARRPADTQPVERVIASVLRAGSSCAFATATSESRRSRRAGSGRMIASRRRSVGHTAEPACAMPRQRSRRLRGTHYRFRHQVTPLSGERYGDWSAPPRIRRCRRRTTARLREQSPACRGVRGPGCPRPATRRNGARVETVAALQSGAAASTCSITLVKAAGTS